MHLVAAMLILSVLQKDDLDKYYQFPDGTKWTYNKKEGEDSGRIELKAIGKKDGKHQIQYLEYKAGEEKPQEKTLLWYVEKGYLRWDEGENGKFERMFTLLPEKPKKGATWKGTGDEDSSFQFTATYKGKQKVKVPLGEYNADYVEMVMEQGGMKMTFKIHLVKNIGIVKYEGLMNSGEGEKSKFLLELKSFSGSK